MPTPWSIRTPDPEALERWLAGDSLPEESRAIRAWVAAEEQRRQTAAGIKSLDTLDGESEIDVDALWLRVHDKLRGPHSAGAADSARRSNVIPIRITPAATARRTLRQRIWLPVSTTLGVVLAGLLAWSASARHRPHSATQSGLTYSTAKGERATIMLPDGSSVALNTASRLEVPTDYVAGNHTLHLTGEALFTVMHHDRNPIVVILDDNTAVKVLGTVFAVRQYPGEQAASVAVQEGRVSVRTTVVAAGQQAIVGPGAAIQLRSASPAQFSFANGVITLDGMPLTDAIPQLNRWYDADIRLGDSSLAQQRIGGTFGAGSLTDLQRVLELTFNVRVVRDGRTLTLFPR